MGKIDFKKYPYLANIGGVPTMPDEGMEDLAAKGWGTLLKQMFDDINAALAEHNVPLSAVCVEQIKEKFGSLRVYYYLDLESTDLDAETKSALYHRVDDIVDLAGAKSEKLCCICGAPAEYLSTGWVLPYCGVCARRNHKITEDRVKKKFDFEKAWNKISG